jgi:fatty-acid desaturase
MKANRSTIDPMVLSAIGIVFPIWTVIWLMINWSWMNLLVVLSLSWFMGIHITIFAHRAWCHKSWTANKVVNYYGLIMFSLCLVGNSIGWVGIHREHHAHCDTDRDPHSPYHKSRWAIQFLSYFNQVKTKYIVDMARDPAHLWFYKWYWWVNTGWLVCLALIDTWLLTLWLAAIGLTVFKLHTINSLCHRTPKYLLPIQDDATSSNSVLMVLLNINNGEAWHKNHHQNAATYRFGHKWYELDPPARIIEILSRLQLARINR